MELEPSVFSVDETEPSPDEGAVGERRVGFERMQDGEIVLEVVLMVQSGEDVHLVGTLIQVAFGSELFASFAGQMEVVEIFDRLLKADRDEQAEDDGGDMDEELFPAIGGVVCGVDVEHGSRLLRSLRNV